MSTQDNQVETPGKMNFQDYFRFKCHPGVGCFTNCCANVTIFLTPYDVLRLKNRLGIQFRRIHGPIHPFVDQGKNQVIPLVVLKMSDNERKNMPLCYPGRVLPSIRTVPGPVACFPWMSTPRNSSP